MSHQPTGLKKIFHQSRRSLSKTWLSLLHPVQIGITGSQGKTNTTELVHKVLVRFGSTVRTDISLDTTYNVPITALTVRPWTKYLVWELGIDHPGEMDCHLSIAHPTIACVTGISPVHTDEEHMGSLEILIQEKRRIIEVLPADGVAVLNHDNEYVREMAEHTKAQIKWYGTDPTCDIWVDPGSIQVTLSGTKATFHMKTPNQNDRTHELSTGLIGTHHVYTLMSAFLLVQSTVKDQDILPIFSEVVSQIQPLKGRMSMEQGPLETILLNDSLRANPESTRAGLDTLERISYDGGRKIAVIGEMGELENPEEEHRKTGEQLATLQLDFIICIGPLRKYTIEAAIQNGLPREKIAYAKDVFEAAEILKNMLQKDDLWYLKGSLLRNYNRILKLLRGEPVCCHEVLCPYEHCS